MNQILMKNINLNPIQLHTNLQMQQEICANSNTISLPRRDMYPFGFERMPLHYLYHFKRYVPMHPFGFLKEYEVAFRVSISFQVVYYFHYFFNLLYLPPFSLFVKSKFSPSTTKQHDQYLNLHSLHRHWLVELFISLPCVCNH